MTRISENLLTFGLIGVVLVGPIAKILTLIIFSNQFFMSINPTMDLTLFIILEILMLILPFGLMTESGAPSVSLGMACLELYIFGRGFKLWWAGEESLHWIWCCNLVNSIILGVLVVLGLISYTYYKFDQK